MTEDRRLTIRIVLQEPINDVQADHAGGLAIRALSDAGYRAESHAAHVGDPAPADDAAWVLRSPAVGTLRRSAG